jgi:Lrp/AsnC family transcriptional regulator
MRAGTMHLRDVSSEAVTAPRPRKRREPAKLDAIDRSILRILQDRADSSILDVAGAVGLSHTPCWRRIKRLEECGVIDRRVTLLDQDAVGLGVTVLVEIGLSRHDEQTLQRFERAIQHIDDVVECCAISGEKDFFLKVVVESIADYDALLKTQLSSLPEVASITSTFVISRMKSTTRLPV